MSDRDAPQKVCFVVMGFGKKTAYGKDHKPRVLDLDRTYEAIIRPAVEENGLRCVRADEMLSSGMIDARMYEMLLRADLVVADISTGNVNAVYELGVRHALRPFSTIIMQEDESAFHFDLSHISTFVYKHLGSDIGSREASEKSKALTELIGGLMATPTRDSPVYEHLRGLKEPMMSDEDYHAMLTVIEEKGDGLAQAIADGRAATARADFEAAREAFKNALAIVSRRTDGEGAAGQSDADYITQQLAFATYKSGKPTKAKALTSALAIIEGLGPDSSNDVETLGITGAIRKRLWEAERGRPNLDKAIEYYKRGFDLQRDYYNGENYALCLEMRADEQEDADEAAYDRVTARKARAKIVEELTSAFASKEVEERPDLVWMHATMANCLFALGREEEALVHEKAFRDRAAAAWMVETYENSKQKLLARRRK